MLLQIAKCSHYIFLSKTFDPLFIIILFLFLLINEYPFTLYLLSSFLEYPLYRVKLLNRIAERLIVILASRSTEWQIGYLIISCTRVIFLIYTPTTDCRLYNPGAVESSLVRSREQLDILGLESIHQCASNSCKSYVDTLVTRSLTVV